MAANNVELLFSWYLRFNGYFLTSDFTVHPNYKKRPGGTDADILAVRFPFSHEYQRGFNFERDKDLILSDSTDFIIVEVKSSKCEINPTWLDPIQGNIEYTVRWMGFLETNVQVQEASQEMYQKLLWKNDKKSITLRFICCGLRKDEELSNRFPELLQIELQQAVKFLKQRFTLKSYQIHRDNWDDFIQEFAHQCNYKNVEELIDWIKIYS